MRSVLAMITFVLLRIDRILVMTDSLWDCSQFTTAADLLDTVGSWKQRIAHQILAWMLRFLQTSFQLKPTVYINTHCYVTIEVNDKFV